MKALRHDLDAARATEALVQRQRQEHAKMAADSFGEYKKDLGRCCCRPLVCPILFGSVRFCSNLFGSVQLCSVLFGYVMLYYVPCSVMLCSVLFGPVRSYFVLLCSVLFCWVMFCYYRFMFGLIRCGSVLVGSV